MKKSKRVKAAAAARKKKNEMFSSSSDDTKGGCKCCQPYMTPLPIVHPRRKCALI